MTKVWLGTLGTYLYKRNNGRHSFLSRYCEWNFLSRQFRHDIQREYTDFKTAYGMNGAKSRQINELLFLIMLYLVCCMETEEESLVYILLWDAVPVFENRLERQYFTNKNCSFQNCFVTDNRSFFNDVMNFDVILFNSVQVSINKRELIFPSRRSAHQKYIFMSSEPSSIYPITPHFNGFFNYTFTYKLDSDFTWRFFVVRNKSSNMIVAPRRQVNWMDINDMRPVSEELKVKLQTKNKAAAWLVSHCPTISKREDLATKLKSELEIYNLTIDAIGLCANPNASPCNNWLEGCHRWLETNYYFYLAFENSMCEDYVTEKILTATKHFAIPIVFGGADYSRYV